MQDQIPRMALTVVDIQCKFPDTEVSRLNGSFRTQLHTEIRITLDGLNPRQQQPIGCGKWSCLCSWALPVCSYAHVHEKHWRSTVNKTVLKGVEDRHSGWAASKLFSDEHWSS